MISSKLEQRCTFRSKRCQRSRGLERIGFSSIAMRGTEPVHVHVETSERTAKFWLKPTTLAWSAGYNSRELRQLREIVEENEEEFIKKME